MVLVKKMLKGLHIKKCAYLSSREATRSCIQDSTAPQEAMDFVHYYVCEVSVRSMDGEVTLSHILMNFLERFGSMF